MYQKIISFINLLKGVKFLFNLPQSKKIMLYDEGDSEILRQITEKDFNILKIIKKKIYFWIFLKQVIFFDFSFTTYCKNYIKFTSPKIIITLNSKRYEFFELKKSFKNIYFISVMSGIFFNDTIKNLKKLKSENLKCDFFFAINKYYINELQKFITSEYRIIGNYKNNLVKINKTKFHGQFLFLSGAYIYKEILGFHNNLLNLVNSYLSKNNKKLHILLRDRSPSSLKEEIDFYKKIFSSNCVFHNNSKWEKKYEILDNFENIICSISGMGIEAIARKKKIAFITPNNFEGSKYYFGWPAPEIIKKNHYFFSSEKLTYNEVERVLNNINNCSQADWEKIHYPVIKDHSPFDENNNKLKYLFQQLS